MCRTIHALLQTVICGIQMMVRVFMTIILMIENLVRMLLQTFYNFVSFFLQMLSLIPICVVFLLTARLKCFMCGGGGPCPVNRGGTCDCLMSAMAIVIVFFIFRATGILDKIFYKLGYAKAIGVTKIVPTMGDITECSRNESLAETTAEVASDDENDSNATDSENNAKANPTGPEPVTDIPEKEETTAPAPGALRIAENDSIAHDSTPANIATTILYYLV